MLHIRICECVMIVHIHICECVNVWGCMGRWGVAGMRICSMTAGAIFQASLFVTICNILCDHIVLPSYFCDHKLNINKNKNIFAYPLTRGHEVLYNTLSIIPKVTSCDSKCT